MDFENYQQFIIRVEDNVTYVDFRAHADKIEKEKRLENYRKIISLADHLTPKINPEKPKND